MRKLIYEAKTGDLSFTDMYKQILAGQPDDPLSSFGLTMDQFGELLNMYGSSPEMRQKVHQLTASAPGEGAEAAGASGSGNKLTLRETIEIHRYISDTLYTVINRAVPGMDSRTATVAAQSFIAARIEKKYGLSPEELEYYVTQHSKELAKDDEFTRIGSLMRSQMNELIDRCTQDVQEAGLKAQVR